MLRGVANETRDGVDAARWEAVEEATELLQERRFADALLALRDVLARDKTNAYAFNYLGVTLFETGRLDEARDAFRAAVTLAPDYLGARVALSHVLRKLGDLEGALDQAKEALRRFPKDGEAMHAAGLAYAARGSRALARKHLEGFLGTNPEFEAESEVRGILEMLGIGGDDEPLDVD
jgi:tetratricopeptide (TPR) repeat protein